MRVYETWIQFREIIYLEVVNVQFESIVGETFGNKYLQSPHVEDFVIHQVMFT